LPGFRLRPCELHGCSQVFGPRSLIPPRYNFQPSLRAGVRAFCPSLQMLDCRQDMPILTKSPAQCRPRFFRVECFRTAAFSSFCFCGPPPGVLSFFQLLIATRPKESTPASLIVSWPFDPDSGTAFPKSALTPISTDFGFFQQGTWHEFFFFLSEPFTGIRDLLPFKTRRGPRLDISGVYT